MTTESAAKPDLAVTETQFSQLVEHLRTVQITSENYPTIMGILVQCKSHAKTFTERRDEALNPAKQTAATIKAWFDPVLKSLEECEAIIKEKGTTHLSARMAARLTAAAAGQAPDPPPPQIDGITTREGWDFKVINKGLLAQDYVSPNEKAIRAAMRENMTEDGPTPIPGVKFFRKVTFAVGAPKG